MMTTDRRARLIPEWLKELMGLAADVSEGTRVVCHGQSFYVQDGILRDSSMASTSQEQTSETFAFKWQQRDTFENPAALSRVRNWLRKRYGEPQQEGWLKGLSEPPIVLDAGCGASMSALEYWGPHLEQIHYLGADISRAVDVARDRFQERKVSAGFIQANLMALPLPQQSVDIIFSEGVLHHTDSTRAAFKALHPFLRPGGLFMFYVYRRKGPVREFTDDHIRERLQGMTSQEGWESMKPLTKLGEALGKLNVEVEVPESVDLIGVPAGRVNIQRLFYWHFCKAFYDPDLSLEEMNHINFDWYAPANAHRHSVEEVRQWCEESGFSIERERVEEAGITIVARKC
jgi:SAM-dependent methyltransferase